MRSPSEKASTSMARTPNTLKALLLAAGRGERMRPLSDQIPKPLLKVGGRALIEWQVLRLVQAGITDIVINLAHLASTIQAALGDGSSLGARIRYSIEGGCAQEALETLGGTVKALPLIDSDTPFVIAASDLYTAFDYHSLHAQALAMIQGQVDAHLILVDNPPYHPQGDLGLSPEGRVTLNAPKLTYASIGLFSPRIFAHETAHKQRLFPWLHTHIAQGRVSGEHFTGVWHNVGTPNDLTQLEHALASERA